MTLENPIFFFKGYFDILFLLVRYAVDLLPLDVFWIILRLFFVRCSYTYVTYFILLHRRLLHTPDLALPTYLRTYRDVLLMLYNA